MQILLNLLSQPIPRKGTETNSEQDLTCDSVDFPNPFPARGRKPTPNNVEDVQLASLSQPIPRKGTETLGPLFTSSKLLFLSQPIPRKGTETSLVKLRRVSKSLAFPTHSPQGDGNQDKQERPQ